MPLSTFTRAGGRVVKLQLFGVGTKSTSPAITAQKRINCFVEMRQEEDKTRFALVGRPGLLSFVNTLGNSPSRCLWAVNTLALPLLFTVHGANLISINNLGVTTVIGAIGTTTGDVSMADDGTYLVLVDGAKGYWYNMITAGALTEIVDGNFTSTPKTVTWQDNYFIVTSGEGRQWQLSQITPSVDPAVWPAVQIGFAGSGASALQAGIADHSVFHLFADVYTEFYQDTGSPDFPFALIPGSAQEFGLAAAFSLAKFDNSVIGLFTNKLRALNVSKMRGFSLQKLSDQDIDSVFTEYSGVSDAQGFAFMQGGHPLYVINFPSEDTSWMYDGLSNAWSQLQDSLGERFWGNKFAAFQDRICVSDYQNGNIYEIDPETYTDNGTEFGMEIWSKHIWQDDKYIGIQQIQIDVESGVGLVSGQGSNPVMDLQVSKDGGNTFFSVGFSSVGPIGEYAQRVTWRSLGAARDWVLKLRITDPVKRVITGATAQVTGWSF